MFLIYSQASHEWGVASAQTYGQTHLPLPTQGATLMHTPLVNVLQERITSIEDALLQIEQHTDAETGLHNIEAHLLNLLELIECSPRIAAAADDLLKAARASRPDHDPDRARLLREAFHRFRKQVVSARLNERGRKMGIE